MINKIEKKIDNCFIFLYLFWDLQQLLFLLSHFIVLLLKNKYYIINNYIKQREIFYHRKIYGKIQVIYKYLTFRNKQKNS